MISIADVDELWCKLVAQHMYICILYHTFANKCYFKHVVTFTAANLACKHSIISMNLPHELPNLISYIIIGHRKQNARARFHTHAVSLAKMLRKSSS